METGGLLRIPGSDCARLWAGRGYAFALLAVLSIALCSLFSVRIADAQTEGLQPTPQQLEMFRNLPPDQQQQLLQQYGGIFGSSGSLSQLGLGTVGSQSHQGQTGTQGQNEQPPAVNPNGETESAVPLLKPEDWVIVEVDFHLGPKAGVALPGGTPMTQGVPANAATSTSTSANVAANSPVAGAGTTTAGGTDQQQQQQLQSQQSANGNETGDEEEHQRLKNIITLIRAHNPYQLSREGVLYLPGFAGIPLAGLIEDLATLRLKVEPALAGLDVRVTRLPLKKTGPEGLKPFGYDLFLRAPSTFAPVTDVPLPADYVVGAGDQLQVQLYGTQNRILSLEVGRDGRVNFPELGPISVSGQRFSEVKDELERRVAHEIVGVRASVSMSNTRAIRIFVLGDATRPGSYTISGLGTITSALYAAGGVKQIGSLRKIELKRQGTLVRQLDLYDLLIRGDTSDDTKLLQGDVIFVPPVGPTVSVDGEVRRPAIYETRGAATVADMLQLAGGLTPDADTSDITLTRIDVNRGRIVTKVDLSSPSGKGQPVMNGDLLRITRLRPTLASGVQVQGHVFTTGPVAWHPGLRLTDVISSVDELEPNADIHYLLIRRELPPDRRITVLSADLDRALRAPDSPANVQLMPRDRITVFDLQSGRDRIIEPVLEELRLQSNLASPAEVVRVDGRVKVPGEYPLEAGMRISDLIRAGGSLEDSAYGGSAELIRYEVVKGEKRSTELINVDLQAVLRGDPKADMLLQPFDLLNIKELPQWAAQETVELKGEVRFPGRYVLKRGETLKSLLLRAGGLTDLAFADGSVFTREELRKREQAQIDELAERLKHDLAIVALESVAASQGNGGGAAISVGQALLGQLRGTKAVGRLVINLPKLMSSRVGSPYDVMLRNGDRLIVPKLEQEVTVIGEVQNATSHLWQTGLTRDDYISMSGGATRRADQGRIYVVRANGSVVVNEGNRWFQRGDTTMRPGDTVVVPLNAEHLPPLPFWQAVTSIIYNVAIAAAAVHSF
jgi:polysaccharide biosynthesis/export protein